MAPAQCGKSAAGRNWLARTVDLEPGPFLIVFPTEASAKEAMDERILPMFEDSPRLRSLGTGRKWDMKLGQAKLQTCTVFVGWAGSPAAVSARAIQYVLQDEIDKNPKYSGREAPATELTDVRTTTYEHRSKSLLISTPTIPTGPINQAYESCPDRRRWHVQCPTCSEWSELVWAHVKWDGMDDEGSDSLEEQQVALDSGATEAYYVLPCCEHEVPDSQRWDLVSGGKWVQETPVTGSKTVAFSLTGLAHPWRSFSRLAKKFVEARRKGLGSIQHFHNSHLGLPFWGPGGKDSHAGCTIDPAVIWAKSRRGHERCLVPAWANVLVASADVGKKHLHWVVRAWGEGFRSRLVDFGIVKSFKELREQTLDMEFHVEGESVTYVSPRRLLIDSGGSHQDSSLTEQVYRFSRTDPSRIFPLKGYGGVTQPLQPVVTKDHTYALPKTKKTLETTLTIVDVLWAKDLLASRINSDDRELWEVCEGITSAYAMQVTAEHKTLKERRVSSDGRVKEVWRWEPRTQGAANHFWDTEVYNCVAAWMQRVDRPRRKRRATGAYAEREEGGETWTIGR